MTNDHDFCENDIDEWNEGEIVLSFGWDCGHPGGAGGIWITEYKGKYFLSSSDYDPQGPFCSLEEVLQLSYFRPTPHPELYSDTVTDEQLKKIARKIVSEEGDVVRINDRLFILHEGVLCPWSWEE